MATDCYVYVLFSETGAPFYVGKGRGRRWYAVQSKPLIRRDVVIAEMRARGVAIPRVKVAEGLTAAQANAVEAAFILAIGREPDGPLVNGNACGGGPDRHSQKTCAVMRSKKKGTTQSNAHRQAISEGLRRMWAEGRGKPGMSGRQHSEATKTKMRIAALARDQEVLREQGRKVGLLGLGHKFGQGTL